MDCSEVAQKVSRHIYANVLTYFPLLNGVKIKVTLVEEQHRTFSSLYRFKIGNDLVHYNIFAKGVPLANKSTRNESTKEPRARLVPRGTDYGERTRLEYNALKTIYVYFEKFDNPNFGAIHVLDFIQNPPTIIMEEYSDPSLRSLFAKTNRLNHLCGRAPDLLRVFFNAGAWLKAYSALPKKENVTTRLSHRDDFNMSIINFTEFLGRTSGNASFFQRIENIVISAANEIMPSNLPLGLGHGDYAMRNILVGADGRITAFDTCAKWKVPVYEDIAYFLVQLETIKLQALTQGFAFQAKTLVAYQKEFLAGYFGETHIPIEVIRLFQIQSLLDNWSSRTSIYTQQTSGMMTAYHKLYLALLNRRYRIIMERLLNKIAPHSS